MRLRRRYRELVDEAVADGRVHARWMRYAAHETPEMRVKISEAHYAQLLFLASFAPCVTCGMIRINVRHDADAGSGRRHAYVAPEPAADAVEGAAA